MIFVTGDTHIPIDIEKLSQEQFALQNTLDKNDYVIICGDFGGVFSGSVEEVRWLDWLEQRPFTTLFVDGNHENFDVLNNLPVQQWKGGKVHFICPTVLHLMRGQAYTIASKRFFTMGGANSIDKGWCSQGISWWPQEMPSDEEYEEAIDTLQREGFAFDYIITHTAPLSVIRKFYEPDDEYLLCQFLQRVKERTSYKKWFFGHVHEDLEVDEKHTALYNKIIQIEP